MKLDVIPKGFRVANKIKDTLPCKEAQCLMEKHSRQWVSLSLSTFYKKANYIKNIPIYPLSSVEFRTINYYKFLLRSVKRKKLDNLLSDKLQLNSRTNETVDNDNETSIGFKNLSSSTFNEKEIYLLNKGPAYVPPPKKLTKHSKNNLKSEIQACFDRIERLDNVMSKSDNFTEFLYGAKRITECEGNRLKEEKNILKTISSIENKAKNVF